MNGWSKAAMVAAELIEDLEQTAAKQGDTDIEVGHVMVIVEISGESDDPDEERWTAINYRCDDPRHWIQMGMLHACLSIEGTDQP